LIHNATTHTAKPFTVTQFRKGKGYDCPVDVLEWEDETGRHCCLETKYINGQTKGLFNICLELKLIPQNAKSNQYKLPTLVELASKHPAFETRTILSELASKYNVKVVYLPKFHCELNPIEGVWAHEKQFIRKNTDQSFDELRRLVNLSRNNLKNSPLAPKLWRRFWRTTEAYHNGCEFLTILKEFFGVKCEKEQTGHRQISDYKCSNINL
jgi:transposase